MSRIKSIALALTTLSVALAVGFVMQFQVGPRGPQQTARVDYSAMTQTSSAALVPLDLGLGKDGYRMPDAALTRLPAAMAPEQIVPAAADAASDVITEPAPQPELACTVTMKAEPTVGALVNLDLQAPCLPGARVTLHHSGMMFTEVTDSDGNLQLSVPALSGEAVFIAAFDDGEGAVANVRSADLPQMDRVVVQWQGNSGLQLHALEFGARYFEAGHVWSGAAGLPNQSADGFLVQLGNPEIPDARLAEVYTYPSAVSARSGTVDLSVEAEVTEANCGREVEAQTLETRRGGALRVQDLTLALPACAAVGEFLVLKNLVEDLTIAAN